MKKAHQILSGTPGPPYERSIHVANAILREALVELGYETSCVWKPYNRTTDITNWVPLAAAQNVRALQSDPVDLEVRDNTSIHLFPPSRRGARKSVMLFHALLGPGEPWLGNDDIDGYWGNSDYMARVVTSFLAMPCWTEDRLLDPRAFAVARRVTLPLPHLDLPESPIETGAGELPEAARAAIESDDVLGHCVSHKMDQKATYAILLALNQMALQSGLGRRFRLFVATALYDNLRRQAGAADPPPDTLLLKTYLGRLGLTLEDILIPVPQLAQPALFQLVRACRFGLQYHWVPEPFGFFPLESVCLGCPVYTNGAGNLRYLLPPGCGIEAQETEAMAFGDPLAYLPVAQRIYEDAVVRPEPAREACRRGADYIAATYTREALRRDLAARLAELEEPPAEHDLGSARLALGPMVRRWNPETRRVLSDAGSVELSAERAALLAEILSQRCDELECRKSPRAMEVVDGLFQQGILTLAPAGAEPAA